MGTFKVEITFESLSDTPEGAAQDLFDLLFQRATASCHESLMLHLESNQGNWPPNTAYRDAVNLDLQRIADMVSNTKIHCDPTACKDCKHS